jgi:hypothetical protein
MLRNASLTRGVSQPIGWPGKRRTYVFRQGITEGVDCGGRARC